MQLYCMLFQQPSTFKQNRSLSPVISVHSVHLLAAFASELFVGESFSSAIRGRNSPGPESVRDNLLLLSEALSLSLSLSLLSVLVPTLVVLTPLTPSEDELTVQSSLSFSLAGSAAGVGLQTVLELPLLAAFTTGGLPEEAQHNGDISAHLLSALRGCNLSGDNALRNNGEPGSEPLGRTNPFFVCPETAVVGVLPALGE